MDKLDELFDEAPARHRLRDFSEDELLRTDLSASDPENLLGVSNDPPPEEEPEVEFSYDMGGRGEMVRCVYCGYPNHFKGIVVRYPSGARRLVGRNCALTHHGVDFEAKLVEFDAAVERQGYARRKRVLLGMANKVLREFVQLRQHPAVVEHDRLLTLWRSRMPDLAAGLANIARRGERLSYDTEVRDIEGEKERRARLGAHFEEERQAAKAANRRWQMFKCDKVDLGPLDGALFFSDGVPVSTRMREIQDKVQQTFSALSGDGLRIAQFRGGFKKLAELRGALAHEYARLEALALAFAPASLARIAKWANDQAADQIRREAALYSEKCPPIYDRYVAKETSIAEWAHGTRVSVALPPVYHAPEQTVLTTLRQATVFEHEAIA